jgi:hypothetical protein
MADLDAPARATSTRRGSAAAGVLANLVLLLLIHAWPGWEVVPFLTEETTQVLGLVNASLLTGIAVGLVQLVRTEAWLVPAGSLVTSAVGLAATVRVLTVFPFDLSPGWETVVRVLLVLGVVGAAIGMLVALISLLRLVSAARGRAPGTG